MVIMSLIGLPLSIHSNTQSSFLFLSINLQSFIRIFFLSEGCNRLHLPSSKASLDLRTAKSRSFSLLQCNLLIILFVFGSMLLIVSLPKDFLKPPLIKWYEG